MFLSSTCLIMGSRLVFISVTLMAMVLKSRMNSPEINGHATTKSSLAKAGPRASSLVPGTRNWPPKRLPPGNAKTDADRRPPLSSYPRVSALSYGRLGHTHLGASKVCLLLVQGIVQEALALL